MSGHLGFGRETAPGEKSGSTIGDEMGRSLETTTGSAFLVGVSLFTRYRLDAQSVRYASIVDSSHPVARPPGIIGKGFGNRPAAISA
jgi:hypothetical protein